MRLVLFLLVFPLLASLTYSAYVYGDIYKSNYLEKLNNTFIKIDGRFSYQMVAKRTNYSLEMPAGDYSLSAEYYDENGGISFYAKQSVHIGQENQRIDLVLIPTGNSYDYVLGAGVAAIAIFVFYSVLTNSMKTKDAMDSERTVKPKPVELDEDAKKVLQALGSFEGRATQKELKDRVGFSDAKLSLILTELEQMEKIKKFKRGRGNIIRKL